MGGSKIILAVNAGSSSLKTTLFEAESQTKLRAIASAEVSGFTSPPAKEKYTVGEKKTSRELSGIESHDAAFDHILKTLLEDDAVPEVKSKDDIDFVCHRVVHGGDYAEDQLINKETYHKIEDLEDLAPL